MGAGLRSLSCLARSSSDFKALSTSDLCSSTSDDNFYVVTEKYMYIYTSRVRIYTLNDMHTDMVQEFQIF